MWKPRRKLRDIYIWMRNRLKPYNVIKIEQLSPDWHDRDSVMFHAIFQILVDFVEKEQPFQPSWDAKDKRITKIYSPSEMREYIETWLGNEAVQKAIDSHIAGGWSPESAENTFRSDRQYKMSMELIDIYEWYKYRRPNRVEYVMNIVRKPRKCRKKVDLFDMLDELDDQDDRRKGIVNEKFLTNSEYFEIQEEYEMIDETMLQKIIARRHFLWT